MESSEKRIFVCDDEEGMRRYLKKMLSGWGLQVSVFAGPFELLQEIGKDGGTVDLLLLDIKMAELDGIETLRRIRELRPDLGVIIMTGHGTIESAVQAMKLGALDYLTKPFPQEKLRAVVDHFLERAHLLAENQALRQELRDRIAPPPVVLASAAFREVYRMALRVAASDANILLLGESGTGKEVIAGTLHYQSLRSQGRFLTVNCAALAETLLESQLFGHVKGAFTGAVQAQRGLLEEADGGTLFLDEVGELSPGLQAKLLRVVQEGEFLPVGSTRPRRVDVRLIAATNRDLEQEVAEGRFREDLFYRLNVISLQLPPLRERPEDIEPLARHFLVKYAEKRRHPLRDIVPEALEILRAYSWPGNVRELENVIARSAILARSELLTPDLLPAKIQSSPSPSPPASPASLSLREAERIQIVRALGETGWNKSRAAALLGITRKTLDKKIADFGLQAQG